MQRTATLVSLIVFMLLLSWLGHSFQQAPPQPPHEKKPVSDYEQKELRRSETAPQERLIIPDRGIGEQPEMLSPGEAEIENLGEPFLPAGEAPARLVEEINTVHFLLLGRSPGSPLLNIIMLVSLIPESHARLTILAPGLVVARDGDSFLLAEFLERGGTYRELCQVTEEITGLAPQFYVELKLSGFIEMVDLLGGVNRTGGSGAAARRTAPGDGHTLAGDETLKLLIGKEACRGDKEDLLIALLVAASEVDNTRLGVRLLWIGFRNIKTNLTLADLIKVRSIAQGISAYRVRLIEIGP